MVDLAIMGHLDSAIYVGAIALGSMIFNFLYWGFAFLRMGTSGFVAQAYGKKDLRQSMIFLSQALFIALIGSLLLLIFHRPIEKICFYLINGSPEVENLAIEYFRIRIWAAPASIGLYALTGWFIGMQNTKIPMIIAILVNIVNIILNLIFVFVFDMKANGVALGTVISQYIGIITGILLLFLYYGKLLKYWSNKAILQINTLKKFLNVNFDIFIRTLCLIFVFSFFTTQSANTSNAILAINTLLLQFLFIFSYFIDGFGYAAEALTGKYIGAGDKLQLKKVIRQLFKWGIGLSIPFTVLYVISGKNLLYILTDNLSIIEQSSEYLIWIGIVPIVSFVAFIWDGIYIGATASKAMRNTMLFSTIVVFLPTYYFLNEQLGNHSLWLGLILFMASRSIFQTYLYVKLKLSNLK